MEALAEENLQHRATIDKGRSEDGFVQINLEEKARRRQNMKELDEVRRVAGCAECADGISQEYEWSYRVKYLLCCVRFALAFVEMLKRVNGRHCQVLSRSFIIMTLLHMLKAVLGSVQRVERIWLNAACVERGIRGSTTVMFASVRFG